MTVQRKLPLRRRFAPWMKTIYIQRLERELMLARAALADEKDKRKAAEAEAKRLRERRW